MNTNKKYRRAMFAAVYLIVLLALPVYVRVHHVTIYYLAVALLIPVFIYTLATEQKRQIKFYYRWQKAREYGFWLNVMREGLRNLGFITAVVLAAQFFGNGYTPGNIVSALNGNTEALVLVLSLLTGFGFLTGVAAWHENNKRYSRIHQALKKHPSSTNQ